MTDKLKPPYCIPFRDAQLKFWHAGNTTQKIFQEFSKWCSSEGVKLVQKTITTHKESRELSTNLTAITKVVPPIFPLLIGDCLHHISTAFDQILTEIAIVHGGDPTRTSMPIRKQRADVEKTLLNSAYENITPRVKDILLNEVQPFRDGNFTLWSTRQLDNIDKHRMITPVVNIAHIDASFIDARGARVIHQLLTVDGGETASFPTMSWPFKSVEVHKIAGVLLIDEPSIFDIPVPLHSYLPFCSKSATHMMELLSQEIYGLSFNQEWGDQKI